MPPSGGGMLYDPETTYEENIKLMHSNKNNIHIFYTIHKKIKPHMTKEHAMKNMITYD